VAPSKTTTGALIVLSNMEIVLTATANKSVMSPRSNVVRAMKNRLLYSGLVTRRPIAEDSALHSAMAVDRSMGAGGPPSISTTSNTCVSSSASVMRWSPNGLVVESMNSASPTLVFSG